MRQQIILTNDGSHTLFVPELNERYHSIHGAIQESKHVFIDAGLNYFIDKNTPNKINIFEVGFGTGLNCFLTLLEALNVNIHYTSVEAFPVSFEFINKLNYVDMIGKDQQQLFNSIHSCDWNKEITIAENFTLLKVKDELQKIELKKTIDIIYFDAFAPTVQPELWAEEIFSKLFNSLSLGGLLVTYCAKGEVKRTLKKVGFTVESIQGPPGKREMIRAIK